MAYYSGQAASYQELLDVLVAACVEQGWTWADGILSKDNAYIKPQISTSNTAAKGPGIIIQGGTGKTGSTLVNPSAATPRLGPLSSSGALQIIFPIFYKIFIFNNPDEVYLIIKTDIDKYYYLTFGVSATDATSFWLSATIARGYLPSGGGGWYITPTSGGYSGNIGATGFFWQETRYTSAIYINDAICDKGIWNGLVTKTDVGAYNAIYPIIPLMDRQPSIWSSETILLPINIIQFVASSKNKLFTQIANARYLRIGNLEPEQILTLGNEKWMVFPFHKKNSAVPNGGHGVDHTGTFGWAIRYDGP